MTKMNCLSGGWCHVGFQSVGLGLMLLVAGNACAQSIANNPTATVPTANIPANATPELKEFLQNRVALAAKMPQLSGGATDTQAMTQFQQQNADLLKRQAQLAQIIAAQQAATPLPTPPPLQMPANASPQMQAFLKARYQLMCDDIAFNNSHRNDDPTRLAALQLHQTQMAARNQQINQMAQSLSTADQSPTKQK